MKVAYFDCFSGISGDMMLGCLVDAGLPINVLKEGLKKLALPHYKIVAKRTSRNSIWGTSVKIKYEEEKTHHGLKDISNIINKSKLDTGIKVLSNKIFKSLATAEAKVHNKSPEEIHFHEVGAIDSIIDIVGTVIGIKGLGIDKIYSSPLHLGTHFVECRHGKLPVPAPATSLILRNTPVYSTGIQSELTTPTGAAIITTLADGFGDMPSMVIKGIGYGAGDKNLPIPNLLRVFIGEKISPAEGDIVSIIETNIDDMNPQLYEYVTQLLFDKGALDVWITQIYMKKGRPGVLLSAICPLNKEKEIANTILCETTTLGVRVSETKRMKVIHKKKRIKTKFGPIQVKIGLLNGKLVNILPEYEECKRIAKTHHIPIKTVYNEAVRASSSQKVL